MKKAKIMLFSLALFAILGGTLAFKAKTSTIDWCSTTTALDDDLCKTGCPLLNQNKRIVQGTPNVYATSLDVNGSPIVGQMQCDVQTLTCCKVRLEED